MFQRTLFPSSAAILFALIFVGGCSRSSSDTSSTSAPMPEPCSLVTQAEVESALGKGATMKAEGNVCQLDPPSGTSLDRLTVDVRGATPEQWEKIKEVNKNAEHLSGLGGDAIKIVGPNVHKGNLYVQVFGFWRDPVAYDKASRYIAEKAASRL